MSSEAPAPAPASAQADRVRGDDSRGSVFLFAAAGIVIYVTLKILDPSISFPLQQISSRLGTWILNALSIPSTLEGTAITTALFSFDVSPDCSGSTSLRIMLTLGALWFGMYPNLTLGRRIVCLVLAAPIAILFNALRVTALVFMGNSVGEPVEGFPHELVGILSFALSMGAVYLMTLLMAKEPEVVRKIGPRAHGVVLALALGVCYAPVLVGPLLSTQNLAVSLIHGAIVVSGLGFLFLTGRSPTHGSPVRSWIPISLFSFSLAILIYGTMTDVITLSSISLLGVLLGIVLYLRGWRFALSSIPLLGAIFLGLPGMHFYWVAGLVGGRAEDGYGTVLLVEMISAVALVAIFISLNLRNRPLAPTANPRASLLPKLGAVPSKIFILAACLGILFQTYFNSQAASFDQVGRLEIPLVLGAWQGVELEPSAAEIEALGRHRIVSREYRRVGSDTINLLANATGADRTRAHPPEVCMTNLGWEVMEEAVITHRGPAGETPMTQLQLRRDGESIEMRYWLADPEGEVYGNIGPLGAVDVTRRLTGKRTDWRVFRVIGRPGSAAFDDFLDQLLPTQSFKTPASNQATGAD